MTDSSAHTISNLFFAYRYPFSDPHWFQKLFMGFLLVLASMLLLFIPSVFLVGYFYRISKRIISEDGLAALPEWDDWGKLFMDGIKLIGASLIYSLPMLLCFVVAFAMLIIPYVNMLETPDNFQGYGVDPTMWRSMLMLLLMYPVMGLSILLSLITVFIAPPALMHLIAQDSFGAAFRLSDWWKTLRANPGGFVIAFLLLLAAFTLQYLGLYILMMSVVLICLYPIFMTLACVYTGMVTFALYGHAYRDGVVVLISKVGDTKAGRTRALYSTRVEKTGRKSRA
jgi:hypothetical protein